MEIARRIWWAWPLWAVSRLPGAMRPMHAAYRWLARRRGCANGACRIDEAGQPYGRQHPAAHRVACRSRFSLRSSLPPWVFMWAMAFALYAGCKWLTYCDARDRGVASDRLRRSAISSRGPGWTRPRFWAQTERRRRPARSEWIAAVAQDRDSARRCSGVAPAALPGHPLLAGWLGMVGLMFRPALRHVPPAVARLADASASTPCRVMQQSAAFEHRWRTSGGRRWNTAFHELATRFTFRPLRLRVGPARGHAAGVSALGLIHELVISLPAHGGYGLPTGYFVRPGARRR